MSTKYTPKDILDKFRPLIIRKDKVYEKNGISQVNTHEPEKYSPENYAEDIVLQIAPKDAIIIEFEDKMVEKCYAVSKKRFPMVADKIRETLSCPEAEHGIYHHRIKWECHRRKAEIRVGAKGFTTCTYLYRDGHITCPLDKSVKEAFELCKRKCSGIPPIREMCDYSCSPEIAYFNYFLDKEIIKRNKRIDSYK